MRSLNKLGEKNPICIGSKFGKLEIIEQSESIRKVWGKKDGKILYTPIYHYKCKCECGEIKKYAKSLLISGKQTSCGCNKYGNKTYKNMSRRLVGLFRNAAIAKGKEWDLNLEYLGDLFEKQNGKCIYTGWDLDIGKHNTSKTASLDRIDSSKGYIKGNVQWTHKDVNIAKNALSHECFLKLCDVVSTKTKSIFEE